MTISRYLLLLALILGVISRESSRAQTWTQTGAPSNAWYAIACSADGARLVAATGGQFVNGQVYTSTNSGTNWSLTGAPSQRWTSVACSADGIRLVAAAYDRAIYTSADAGTSWTSNNIPSLPNALWLSVSSSADGARLFAVPYGNGLIYHSTNSGAIWLTTTNALADPVSVATSADGTIAVAGDNNGHVATTTNSGAIWSPDMTLTPPFGTVVHVNASAEAQRLMAVVFGGGVFSSTNRGLTWTSNSLPPNSSWLVAVSSADGTRLTVAAQKGLLYSSMDSGTTWISNSAPGLLWQSMASTADGNVVFAAPSNGAIWVRRTTPAPVLGLKPSTQGPILLWLIPSANFVLQQSAVLANPSWSDLTNAPVLNLTNLQNRLTLPWAGDTAFFRLRTE